MSPEFMSNEPLPPRFPKPEEYETWTGTEHEHWKAAWNKYEQFSEAIETAATADELLSAITEYAVTNNEGDDVIVAWVPFGSAPEYDLETPLEKFTNLFEKIKRNEFSPSDLEFVHGEMSLHHALYTAFLRIYDLEQPKSESFDINDLR